MISCFGSGFLDIPLHSLPSIFNLENQIYILLSQNTWVDKIETYINLFKIQYGIGFLVKLKHIENFLKSNIHRSIFVSIDTSISQNFAYKFYMYTHFPPPLLENPIWEWNNFTRTSSYLICEARLLLSSFQGWRCEGVHATWN